jgi:hypothetical protein
MRQQPHVHEIHITSTQVLVLWVPCIDKQGEHKDGGQDKSRQMGTAEVAAKPTHCCFHPLVRAKARV